jgi:hypothetical protein
MVVGVLPQSGIKVEGALARPGEQERALSYCSKERERKAESASEYLYYYCTTV